MKNLPAGGEKLINFILMLASKGGFFFNSSINLYFLLWRSPYVSLLRDLLTGLRSYLLP